MANQQFPIVMEEVTDPEELAKARVRRERFDCAASDAAAHRDRGQQTAETRRAWI